MLLLCTDSSTRIMWAMTEAGHVDDQHSLRYSRALPGLFTRAVGNTYHGRYIRWAHQQGLPSVVSRILGPRTANHMWVLAMFLEAGRGRYTVAVVDHTRLRASPCRPRRGTSQKPMSLRLRVGVRREPGRGRRRLFVVCAAPDSQRRRCQIGIDQEPLPDPAWLWYH